MEQRARDALKIGKRLFEKKQTVDSLWQEIALNFYPERADFTTKRNDGDEFADHLFSSYPVMARRELGNMVSSFLYSRTQPNFSIHVSDEELDQGNAEREWLEGATTIQRRAMYDPAAGLSRAMKESAHDQVSFGNAVTKFTTNDQADGLLFRTYHLRDCAWSENAEGQIDQIHRKWCPSARQLEQHFPQTISEQTRKLLKDEPEKEVECRHIILPSRLYKFMGRGGRTFPYVSLYIEVESETVLEETGMNYFCYVIPRWQTVSGSQYAHSMVTSILLPDGRTAQVITRTIREAGEKYVDPPMIAVMDAIRGDLALYAGGVTTADMEYDEKLGEVLRPITKDRGGMPIGFEIAAAIKQDIQQGFFLDKIQLPENNKDMTAFEVRRRIEEQIRAQAPIFDPLEEEYAPLYDGVFNLMREHGAFPFTEMPESIAGSEIRFTFRSPLSDLSDERDAQIFVDGLANVLAPSAEFDPAQVANVNITEGTRDALRAKGFKAKWLNPKEAVAQKQEEMARAQQMAQGMEALGAAGQVAEQGGKGIDALAKAGGTQAA